MDNTLIFQRTHSGRTEIQEKSHGLTQSQRLVLIMVDSVTPYGDVRKKLPVLSDERFARAFTTLAEKELIVEVFLPMDDQAADIVERTVIDRFLQQDPLDPVTIIVDDPEDVFGEVGIGRPPTNRAGAKWSEEHLHFEPRAAITKDDSPPNEAAMDHVHIAMADSLTDELRARRLHRQGAAKVGAENFARQEPIQRKSRPSKSPALQAKPVPLMTNWPYWCIGIGLAFIAGFAVAKLSF